MKLPPQMIELFLRSSGAPPALLELYRLVESQGFGAFRFSVAPADDPLWARIGVDPARKQTGVWFRAEGEKSRVTAAVFFEGDDNEVLAKLDSLGLASGG